MVFDAYYSPLGETRLLEVCARIRHLALDMDGTIYMGMSLFPYTNPFLQTLRDLGIGYTFLTNNPTRSADDYLAKLRRLGVEAERDQMYTSSMATIDYLKLHRPEIQRLFVLGTPSMQEEFRRAGFVLTADDPDDRPDALLVAFDTTLEYGRLCRAAWWAAQEGMPYIATNPDWVCPTDERTVLVECGSLCKALEGATGRKPDLVIGKPSPGMLWCIRDRYGLENQEIAMVGDRIYTDVACGVNAGVDTVLVLSGETKLADVETSDIKPTFILQDVKELLEILNR